MRYLRILKDWNLGSSSNIEHRLLKGNIYNCPDEEKANDLVKRGIAVEVKFGWLPQAEDKRDYTFNFPKLPGVKATLPALVDLRTTGFMPGVVDQESHGICTAAAKVGVNGYMEAKQGHVSPPPFSENFVYYETVKNIEGGNPLSDPGATIRGTFQEGQRFGACKRTTWPYDNQHFGIVPNATAIAEALQYQDLFYASLDPVNTPVATILGNVKNMVAAGYPVEFGFNVYSNYTQVGANGLWPYPVAGTYLAGGHAVDVVGYNDSIRCPNTNGAGAFLCRNSWGSGWGMAGYFWLPYEFVTRSYNGRRLAQDFWALGKIEWMNV